jgi:hypothetical protein
MLSTSFPANAGFWNAWAFMPIVQMRVFNGLVRELQSQISHAVVDRMHGVETKTCFTSAKRELLGNIISIQNAQRSSNNQFFTFSLVRHFWRVFSCIPSCVFPALPSSANLVLKH